MERTISKLASCSDELKVGRWVVLTEDGVYCSAFNDAYTFATKKDAVLDVSDAMLDPRKTPKVVRISIGNYLYTPRDCDSGEWASPVRIVKVTEQNIEELREQVRVQEDDEYD